MRKPFDLSLYLVLDPQLCGSRGMAETTRAAVAGGVTMVQLRDKRASTSEMVETGKALQAVLAGTGVPLVVNDDVEAAIALGADGLHVGQHDCDAHAARQRIGPDMILGLSVETEALARVEAVTPRRRCSGCAQWWPTRTAMPRSSRNWPTSCACTPSTTKLASPMRGSPAAGPRRRTPSTAAIPAARRVPSSASYAATRSMPIASR